MVKKFVICVNLWILICVNLCSAKDLLKRTGIGFNSQISGNNVNSLSIRHWVSKKIGIEGLVGFSLGDDTIFDIGVKLLRILKEEQNLNLYGFGLVGTETAEVGNSKDTLLTVSGGFGIEFFFNEFPNLGFGTELGLGFNNANNKEQFGTFAGWLTVVGIRYYQ
ncbi:MAG: hypothetical protein AB1349_09915 [Elusimicrobiota bacterium]